MPTTSSNIRLALSALTLGSLILPTALHAAPAASKTAVSTPKPGSPERKALMDALRRQYAHDYHETVVFRVNWLKVGGGYAYLDGAALGANGQPAREFAPMGGSVSAFYRRQNGHWKVLRWGSFGGTDLVDECRQKYPNAPHTLFP